MAFATVRMRMRERSGCGRVWLGTARDTLDPMEKKGRTGARVADGCNPVRIDAAGAST